MLALLSLLSLHTLQMLALSLRHDLTALLAWQWSLTKAGTALCSALLALSWVSLLCHLALRAVAACHLLAMDLSLGVARERIAGTDNVLWHWT